MLDEMLQRIHRTCAIHVSITSKHDTQGHGMDEFFAHFLDHASSRFCRCQCNHWTVHVRACLLFRH